MIRKINIKKLFFPVDCYNYYVEILTKVNDYPFAYCGMGEHAKTLEEAQQIKKKYETKFINDGDTVEG